MSTDFDTNISTLNKSYIASQTQKQPEEAKEAPSDKSKNKKILIAALAGLAAPGAAAVAVYKHKNAQIKIDKIKFYGRVAKLKKTGETFTGEVCRENAEGKLVLEFKDGILQKSSIDGGKVKEYVYDSKGSLSKIIIDGSEIDVVLNKKTVKAKADAVEECYQALQAKPQELKQYSKEHIGDHSPETNVKRAQLQMEEIQARLKLDEVNFPNKQLSEKERNELAQQMTNLKRDLKDYTIELREQEEQKAQEAARQAAKEAQKMLAQKQELKVKEVEARIKELEALSFKRELSFEEAIELEEKKVQLLREKIEHTKLSLGDSYEPIHTEYLERQLEEQQKKLQNSRNFNRNIPLDLSKAETPYSIEEACLGRGVDYSNILERDCGAVLTKKDSAEHEFFKANHALDLDSKVNLFEGFEQRVFDVPERFAIMADNSLRKTGNAYIHSSTPKIFEGIEEKEVFDTLSKFARSECEIGTREITFSVGDKKIVAHLIGGGQVGTVYRLTDEAGNSAAIKLYRGRGKTLNINSGLVEIATSRQLALDGVGDVPKFYMANAGLYKFGEDGKTYEDVPWMLSQYVDNNVKPARGSDTLKNWLERHNMVYADVLNGRSKGGILLDIGGCVSKDCVNSRAAWGTFGFSGEGDKGKYGLNNLLEHALERGFGAEEILKLFK